MDTIRSQLGSESEEIAETVRHRRIHTIWFPVELRARHRGPLPRKCQCAPLAPEPGLPPASRMASTGCDRAAANQFPICGVGPIFRALSPLLPFQCPTPPAHLNK